MSPPRDPESTRRHLLEVSAEEMRFKGYKAASLADILNKAKVSKGALYHHFANKQELGYAVFDEIFVREFLADWDVPMSNTDPIDAVCQWITEMSEQATREKLQQGCPVCNIATEMVSLDEGFRDRTQIMFDTLRSRIAVMLSTAKLNGQVKQVVVPESVSSFIVATVQGAMMQGKYGRDLETFKAILRCLADYLTTLKT